MLFLARVAVPLLLVASCVATPARLDADFGTAQTEAAARGFAYASEVCAACHAVSAGEQNSPDPNAPPFVVIANLPGMTSTALNAWLHSAHPTMPSLIISPDDRADIAAYLDSIKRREGVT